MPNAPFPARVGLLFTTVLLLWCTQARAQSNVAVPLRSVVYLQSEKSRGAGVIISSDGLVITSTRSVSRGREITASLYGGPGTDPLPVAARVVARDDWFTLLQLDGQAFRPATLGSTHNLRQNDRVVVLDDSGSAFSMGTAPLSAVQPLNPKAPNLQAPLVVITQWNGINAGGPVFGMDGNVVALLQGPADGNFGGTKALRVEDIRDFVARSKELIPPRVLTLTGEGYSAQSELIPESGMPLSIRYKPGDILTLRLKRNGKMCGVLRPDLGGFEPVNTLNLGFGGTGTLKVESNVKGAQVTVDGSAAGTAPLNLDCMGPGSYSVQVSAKNAEGVKQAAVVRAGETTAVNAFLRRMEGLLRVSSTPPGGEVWVDGEMVGITPVVDAAVGPGQHAVSVRFPGGARVRRAVVFEDRKIVNLGTVNLPPPGALLSVEHTNVKTLYIDGQAHKNLKGLVVLTPGTHVVQAEDDLGNVLTDTWEAPPGGHRAVKFNGGTSVLLPAMHMGGAVSLVGGGLLLLAGGIMAGGVPLGTLLGAWALGGVLDAIHRQLWIPTVVLGGVLAAPLLVLGAAGLLGALMLIPWERFLAEGRLVPASAPETPLPFELTPGWEPRGVAQPLDDMAPPPPDAPAQIVPQRETTAPDAAPEKTY